MFLLLHNFILQGSERSEKPGKGANFKKSQGFLKVWKSLGKIFYDYNKYLFYYVAQ